MEGGRQRAPEAHQRGHVREPSADDEITFSGINKPTDIPSKSFQRLQQNIGGAEIDTTSIRGNVSGGDDECIGGYDEASIRYRGRNIPSKSFRMLQNLTGGSELTVPHVDSASTVPPGGSPIIYEEPADYHQVQPVPTGVPPQRKQPRRRRQREPKTEDEVVPPSAQQTPFDEDAFLAGQIPIMGGSGQTNLPPRQRTPEQPVPWRKRAELVDQPRYFDEDTYLKLSAKVKQKEAKPEEEEEKPFDEQAYLMGRIPLVRGGTPDLTTPLPVAEDRDRYEEQDQQHNQRPFDEDAYLSGNLNLLGGSTDAVRPSRVRHVDETPAAPWVRSEEVAADYDESTYLSGKVALVRCSVDVDLVPRHHYYMPQAPQQDFRLPAPWTGREEKTVPDELFDEDAYLRTGTIKQREGDSPEYQEDEYLDSREPESTVPDELFDEEQYLRTGQVKPSQKPQDADLLKESKKDSKLFHQRAPWERDDANEDATIAEGDFDEDAFLKGRLSLGRGVSAEKEAPAYGLPSSPGFTKIPSKAFMRLTRSVSRECSREGSPFYGDEDSGYRSPPDAVHEEEEEEEEEENQGEAYDDLVYTGKDIPSRTFHVLQKNIGKSNKDPYNVLRQRGKEDGLDVDEAIEKLDIDSHQPDHYLEVLKQSVQEGDKVEYEDEVTDF